MENYTVCQLQRDMRYEGFLLIRSAEKRKDSKGNDYVDMNLGDRTGEINCKIWNWDPAAEMPAAGRPVKIRGTIQEYNGRLQLRVEKWRQATDEDPVDMNALVPCAPRKPQEMIAEIDETVDSFRNEDLKKLVRENVTFIFKSFERQRMSRQLCANIGRLYPGTRIIVADDSCKPLIVRRRNVKVIQMPYNSGLFIRFSLT